MASVRKLYGALGLLTSTLCCRWVGSKAIFCRYSFRCTAVAGSKGVRAEEGVETGTTIGGGQCGEGETGGRGFREPRGREGDHLQ